jgi:hypothetical protein
MRGKKKKGGHMVDEQLLCPSCERQLRIVSACDDLHACDNLECKKSLLPGAEARATAFCKQEKKEKK